MTRNEEAAKAAARRRRLMLGVPEEADDSSGQEKAKEPAGVPALNEAVKALGNELFPTPSARRRAMLGLKESN
ncbi:hypothetical protein [Micromonospora cremea]|uniref:Uncharacterized protein n=1 Tax=Micromonospora cremea TaxID=709881 RepID=A0A1N5YY13_9ACTN|nr:hypothetical protein [Micromonospora cremea]SIN14522.1 hypothetical protein SAMN04489832_3420 [Micromonospora cremea]